MGRTEREKGRRGELEIAAILRKHGFVQARRTAQYSGRSGDAADVAGLPGFHVEVKRCETTRLHEWMEQAIRDSSRTGKMPVVFHRRSREPWLATLHLDDLLHIISTGRTGADRQLDVENKKDADSPVITRYNYGRKGGQDCDTE